MQVSVFFPDSTKRVAMWNVHAFISCSNQDSFVSSVISHCRVTFLPQWYRRKCPQTLLGGEISGTTLGRGLLHWAQLGARISIASEDTHCGIV